MKYPFKNKHGEQVDAPQGNMRERLAAAIRAARPANYTIKEHINVRLHDPVGYYFYNFCEAERKLTEEWADFFFIAAENVGLQIKEINEDVDQW